LGLGSAEGTDVAVSELNLFIKRLASLPNDALGFLTREHGWQLRYPTNIIISHFLSAINEADADMIRAQLAQPWRQSWWLKGRINPIFHYLLEPATLLTDPFYEDGLFLIAMRVDGKKLNANVTFATGRLYSVELPKPFAFFKNKELVLGEVTRGNPRQSISRAIDRSEHGRNPEES
jgi:hypothetical protein